MIYYNYYSYPKQWIIHIVSQIIQISYSEELNLI